MFFSPSTAGGDVGLGQVVGHEDLDARDLVELAVGVRTRAEPVAVEHLGGLIEQVELRRAQDEATFLFGHVLLVESLGAGENGLGKQFAVGGEGGPALDDGAAGFVVDDAGAAGRKHGDAHGRLVEAFGEGHAEPAWSIRGARRSGSWRLRGRRSPRPR